MIQSNYFKILPIKELNPHSITLMMKHKSPPAGEKNQTHEKQVTGTGEMNKFGASCLEVSKPVINQSAAETKQSSWKGETDTTELFIV